MLMVEMDGAVQVLWICHPRAAPLWAHLKRASSALETVQKLSWVMGAAARCTIVAWPLTPLLRMGWAAVRKATVLRWIWHLLARTRVLPAPSSLMAPVAALPGELLRLLKSRDSGSPLMLMLRRKD